LAALDSSCTIVDTQEAGRSLSPWFRILNAGCLGTTSRRHKHRTMTTCKDGFSTYAFWNPHCEEGSNRAMNRAC